MRASDLSSLLYTPYMPRQRDDARPTHPLWLALDDLMHQRRSNPTQLARDSAVSHATIYGIRNGRTPYPDTLERLAQGLARRADGSLDETAAQDNFAKLMQADGYAFVHLQGEAPPPDAVPPSLEEHLSETMRDPKSAEVFARTAREFSSMSAHQREAVLAVMRAMQIRRRE